MPSEKETKHTPKESANAVALLSEQEIRCCKAAFRMHARAVANLDDFTVSEVRAFAKLVKEIPGENTSPPAHELVGEIGGEFRRLWRGVMERQAEEKKATLAPNADAAAPQPANQER